MTAHSPATAPNLGNYADLRQRVSGTIEGIEHRPDGTLTTPELFGVIREASQGILAQLQQSGIREAGTLAYRLAQAAETDETADLSLTVAAGFTEEEAKRSRYGDVNAQAQQQRMALLARAVGDTASAIVSSVVNPKDAGVVVANGKDAVGHYRQAVYKKDGADLLEGLLNQTEAAAEQAGR